MLGWDDLRFFLALQRGKTLAAAARTLRVNQTTVWRRMRALESESGVRLFDRTTYGYQATAAGESLVARAERMEEEMNAAARELGGREARLEGTVRVTGPGTFGFVVVVPLLAKFQRRYPGIVCECVADDRILSLSSREADIALRMQRPRQPNLIARHLSPIGVGLYASRAYLKKHPTVRRGLNGHDLVGFDETYQPVEDVRWLREHGQGARVVLRANSAHMIAEAVDADFGLGIFPCYLARRFPRLVRVFGPEELGTLSLWLAIHPDLRPSARIRALADFLTDEISAMKQELAG